MKLLIVVVILAFCAFSRAKLIPLSPVFNHQKINKLHTEDKSRIISGQPAKSGQFPYQVALSTLNAAGEIGLCGGSLISEKWVLTAAHCAAGVIDWEIRMGGIRLDRDEPTQLKIKSSRGIVHPGFNEYLNNDIALIELPKAIKFTDYIKPIRLPSKSEIKDRLEDIEVTVSGWGYTYDGAIVTSPILNFVDIVTISNDLCKLHYGSKRILKSNLCAEGHPNHGPCSGDSGGPLVRIAEDGLLTQVGIVSFGTKNGCSDGLPSVYARTASYLDWISENTGISIKP